MPHLCLPLLLALLPAFVSQQAGGHILSLRLSDYSTDMPARTSTGEFCHRQRTPCDPTFEVESEMDLKHIRRTYGILQSREFYQAGNIPGVLLRGSLYIGDYVPKRLKVIVTANDISLATGDKKRIFRLKLAVNVTSFPITRRRITDRHGNFNLTVSISLVCSHGYVGLRCEEISKPETFDEASNSTFSYVPTDSNGDVVRIVTKAKTQLQRLVIVDQTRIDEIFLRYRAGCFGYIDVNKLKQLCKNMKLPFDEFVADALMSKFGSNGRMTLEQWRRFILD